VLVRGHRNWSPLVLQSFCFGGGIPPPPPQATCQGWFAL